MPKNEPDSSVPTEDTLESISAKKEIDPSMTPKLGDEVANVSDELRRQAGDQLGQTPEVGKRKYQIELVGDWAVEVPLVLREKIEGIISWEIPHEAGWYPLPGRTLIVRADNYHIKVKGAGFYNPGNVSYAGIKRTTTPVPEGPDPMRPIQKLFERDLVHSDPSTMPPHALESVHSIFAPIGGMALSAAVHDQTIFSCLQAAKLPSNRPLAAYENKDLKLRGKPMGVSLSLLPEDVLQATAFQLYIAWNQSELGQKELCFFKKYSGRGEEFSYENPNHRLEVLAKLARVAGKLLFEFSSKAGLYRFSGGPDNWNIKDDLDEPLYFSDVDTSRQLDTIPPAQRGWEVLRNLNSAIHSWFYYFLPTLTHPESGYTAELLKQKEHNFVKEMLLGFFPDKSADEVEKVSSKIQKFFELPLSKIAEEETPLGLRTGEYFLQKFYTSPVFHLTMLSLISELVQGSEFQRAFPESDTSPEGIRQYVDRSTEHESHAKMFPNYSVAEAKALIAQTRAAI